MGGRGTGKTITGANWILECALNAPGTKWGVASSTASELESVCFRGDSGILSQALPGEIAEYNVNKMRVELRNGSVIQGYSADSPDRIRGANLHGLWYDEAASSRYPRFWYESARPAVRLGDAKILITTTRGRRNCCGISPPEATTRSTSTWAPCSTTCSLTRA